MELAILPDVPTAKEADIGSHLDSERFRSAPRTD
jgi:hypothetical protein